MRSIWRDDIPQTADPIRFFLHSSKPHVVAALVSCTAVVIAASLNAYVPYLYKLITDNAIAFADTQSYLPLVWAVGGYILVSTTAHLLWRVSGFAGALWATGTRATGRSGLSHYLSLHSYQYFSDRFAGSLLS